MIEPRSERGHDRLPDSGGSPASRAVEMPPIEIIEPLCSVFRRRLKLEGLKYTPERAQILDAVIRHGTRAGGESGEGGDGIFQADELLESMRREGMRVSKATIYRTIKLLADAGILQQVLFDSEHAHYQLAYGRKPSGVLIDAESGRTETFEAPELTALVERVCRARGLKAEGHRFVIYAKSTASREF